LNQLNWRKHQELIAVSVSKISKQPSDTGKKNQIIPDNRKIVLAKKTSTSTRDQQKLTTIELNRKTKSISVISVLTRIPSKIRIYSYQYYHKNKQLEKSIKQNGSKHIITALKSYLIIEEPRTKVLGNQNN
jgi:hypothetical protein